MHMGFRMSFALSHAFERTHYAAPTIRHLAANPKSRLTASSTDRFTVYFWFRFSVEESIDSATTLLLPASIYRASWHIDMRQH